jgi:uncharacterized membrane protein YdcZ (DUF606 family)
MSTKQAVLLAGMIVFTVGFLVVLVVELRKEYRKGTEQGRRALWFASIGSLFMFFLLRTLDGATDV